MADLQRQFGQIDIYLFDLLLRGHIAPRMRILDAGCGGGRNLVYLLREGYDVFGVDEDAQAIAEVRRLAAALAPELPADHFQVRSVEETGYPEGFFDVAISSAVLHFAQDDRQFRAMLKGMWRVLKPGGLLFCRLTSSIGIEKQVKRLGGRRFFLPDGSERYLVDAAMLGKLTKELNAELVDPIKSTVVEKQRSMATWILRKSTSGLFQ